uniref:Uncharacterized protein n=1 Tax=Rhizophora mucronata TaxID=61149 RepID=A0A2P2P6W2_RHIMU
MEPESDTPMGGAGSITMVIYGLLVF